MLDLPMLVVSSTWLLVCVLERCVEVAGSSDASLLEVSGGGIDGVEVDMPLRRWTRCEYCTSCSAAVAKEAGAGAVMASMVGGDGNSYSGCWSYRSQRDRDRGLSGAVEEFQRKGGELLGARRR